MSRAKRALDLIGSLAGLALLWPLLLGLAVCVWCADGGPAFFRQLRIGRDGRPFRIWKLRTMVADAERRGGALTSADDTRVTGLGRWLRRHKLDELPQLLNVIAGQMSLVGPRPEVPRYVAHYTPEQARVLALTPGITDPASLAFYDESELLAQAADPEAAYLHDILPEKLRLNLAYAASATVVTDLRVIAATVGRLVLPRRGIPPLRPPMAGLTTGEHA